MSPEWVEIIILAVVAVFIISRLYAILGRKVDVIKNTEHPPRRMWWDDATPSMKHDQETAPVSSVPLPTAWPPLSADLQTKADRLTQAMPDFDAAEFVRGASLAFAMIYEAYREGKLSSVAQLMNKAIFKSWSQAYESGDAASIPVLRRVLAAEIQEISLENATALVTVSFVSEQQVTTPLGPVDEVVDVWIFARECGAKTPDWVLVQAN